MAKYGKEAHRQVEKEMRHRKTKKHGSMSRKQAVAIGLSKARRKGGKAPRRKSSRGGRKSKGSRKK